MSDGELWIDHRCLFHDDAHESASWQEDSGVYFCRTQSKVFAVPLVMEALLMGQSTPAPAAARAPVGRKHRTQPEPAPAPPKYPRDKALAVVYEYRFPDGRLSHRKYRVGDGAAKTIWQEGPNGEPSLPDQTWPIYGDNLIGSHLIVVEGEKCVEIITDVDESFEGSPIWAITCGSVADLTKHADLLAERIRDLHPQTVTLWPDFDQPGLKAMEQLSARLLMLNVEHRVIDPEQLGLPNKGDVVDFVLAGGKLASVIRTGSLPHSNGDADGIVSRAVVTRDGRVVFPGTRNLVSISQTNATAIWYDQAHALPTDKQSKELAARLQVKSQRLGLEVAPRQHNTRTETWWRPKPTGPAVHISANGVELSDDPEGYFLQPTADILAYPPDVDLDGSRADLEALAAKFHLSETELILVEAWLVCAIAGLQTPIMFMRAPAGTGKTTLARLLLAVVEPLCPELDMAKRQNPDMREFIRIVRETAALLIDNVSKLDGVLEDQLAKIVTGYSTSLRTLYTDATTSVHLRRAVILTTTSYDVYKGDLAQRMIVVQPSTEQAFRWLPDSVATEQFGRYIPRIRGHIMHQLVRYYRERPSIDVSAIRFRIGDLGLVLASLGHDTADIAKREAAIKSEVIGQNDAWLEALVAFWKDENSTMFVATAEEITKALKDFGITELPPAKSPRLARYLEEKNPIFADHGFTVTKVRTASWRGYRFSVYGGNPEDVNPELDLDSGETAE